MKNKKGKFILKTSTIFSNLTQKKIESPKTEPCDTPSIIDNRSENFETNFS